MTKQERRKEQKHICEFLKSDLFRRDRRYAEEQKIVPIEHDPHKGMVWGSPLGWRVHIEIDDPEGEDQSITLTIYRADGSMYYTYSYTDGSGERGWQWLKNYVP